MPSKFNSEYIPLISPRYVPYIHIYIYAGLLVSAVKKFSNGIVVVVVLVSRTNFIVVLKYILVVGIDFALKLSFSSLQDSKTEWTRNFNTRDPVECRTGVYVHGNPRREEYIYICIYISGLLIHNIHVPVVLLLLLLLLYTLADGYRTVEYIMWGIYCT